MGDRRNVIPLECGRLSECVSEGGNRLRLAGLRGDRRERVGARTYLRRVSGVSEHRRRPAKRLNDVVAFLGPLPRARMSLISIEGGRSIAVEPVAHRQPPARDQLHRRELDAASDLLGPLQMRTGATRVPTHRGDHPDDPFRNSDRVRGRIRRRDHLAGRSLGAGPIARLPQHHGHARETQLGGRLDRAGSAIFRTFEVRGTGRLVRPGVLERVGQALVELGGGGREAEIERHSETTPHERESFGGIAHPGADIPFEAEGTRLEVSAAGFDGERARHRKDLEGGAEVRR